MKPKDLKIVIDAESTLPLLEDRVFFMPRAFLNHDKMLFPPWDDPSLFGNQNPVCIEYCSGNGAWIAEKALQSPEKNWLAVEMRFDRVQKIWSKIKNHQIKNLVVVRAEALSFSRFYLQSSSVDEVYINFPDPWPKRRHEKNRLMNVLFLEELARILKNGKSVTFVTDEEIYLKSTIKNFTRHPKFQSLCGEPHYFTDWEDYGISWFENLWREKGKTIFYTRFIKNES